MSKIVAIMSLKCSTGADTEPCGKAPTGGAHDLQHVVLGANQRHVHRITRQAITQRRRPRRLREQGMPPDVDGPATA